MVKDRKAGRMIIVLLAFLLCMPQAVEAQRGIWSSSGVEQKKASDKGSSRSKKKKKKGREETQAQPSLQEGDVQLTVVADGATKDEAIQAALRNAIEQAFGVFVSSHTEILNDELVKDEIATVASGNIKSYTCVSENVVDDKWLVTVRAVVSTNNLVRYTESKGSSAELAGSTFAMNIKLHELYRKNEELAIRHLMKQLAEMVPQMFDYRLEMGDFVKKGSNVECDFMVMALPNANAQQMRKLFLSTLSALSMSEDEYKQCVESGFSADVIYLSNKQCDEVESDWALLEKRQGGKTNSQMMRAPYMKDCFYYKLYLRNDDIAGLLVDLENWILVNAMCYRITDDLGTYTTQYVKQEEGENGKDCFMLHCHQYNDYVYPYETKMYFKFSCDHIVLKSGSATFAAGGYYQDDKLAELSFMALPDYAIRTKGYLHFSNLEAVSKLTKVTVEKATPNVTFDAIKRIAEK